MAPGKPRIALVSMPWTVFHRPSIQLAALKAYAQRGNDQAIDCFHPYLDIAKAIGIESYSRLAGSGWAGEAIFSALLFPENITAATKLFNSSLGAQRRTLQPFAELAGQVRHCCSAWLDSIDWRHYGAAGFSICFNQLLGALYMAAELKNRHPEIIILFGGSSCCRTMGTSLLRHFPQIDHVIDGEGERAFADFCRWIRGQESVLPAAILSREHTCGAGPSPPSPFHLEELPIPDYADYFREIAALFPDRPFIPEIPIEFSRGCWWNRCTFCNLNLQWQGYRKKSAARMASEVQHLSKTHQVLDFCFTDNALPPKEAEQFFTQIAGVADYRFFAEIRATTSLATLHLYRQAGLRVIQVGIEALAPSLLARMRKGTRVIDNVAIMKHAAEAGITLEGNLIIEFPGSTEEEVDATLACLDFLLPYAPLATAAFFLGTGSPIHQDPTPYRISAILPHAGNRALFPARVLTGLELLANGYRGDRKRQRRLWHPVRAKVRQWQAFHDQRKNRTPPLSYRDGTTFLIIRQELPDGPVLRHRLVGTSRDIYLFCGQVRTVEEITGQFPRFSAEAIGGFVRQLSKKHLMFCEDDRILSLAIKES